MVERLNQSQFEQIVRSCEPVEKLSQPARTACQGVECSYSHQACKRAFENPSITFYERFEDVFAAVYEGTADYGVVPIENTLAGSVTDNYDLITEYNLYIVGSVTVPIVHSLLGVEGSTIEGIRDVYSHPQALHQCSEFFRANRQITTHDFSNTAASAKYIADLGEPSSAAIGSLDCAEKYHLIPLKEGLQNRKDNFTRFVILSKKAVQHPQCGRISLIIRVAHRAGALYGALSRFASRKINLLKLESRPIPDSPFEFLFYWDFAGNLSDSTIQAAIQDLLQDIVFLKNLGNYPEM